LIATKLAFSTASKASLVSSSPPDFAPIRFTSDDLPERDRLAQWREAWSRTIMEVDVEPVHDAPFRCEAVLRALPGVGLASFTISPGRATRTRAMVADGNDDLVLILSSYGRTVVSAHGREATLGCGDAILMSSAEPSVTHIRTPSKFHWLALPLAALAPRVSDLDATLAAVIPGNIEAVRLLSRFVESLNDDIALSSPELRRLAVSHVYDLAAFALGAPRDAGAISQERGLRAVQLEAIKSDIAARASETIFSIDEVAFRHGVSPRYIRRLFEGTGTTFTEYALEQRLLQAYRMLTDPRYGHHPIGSIALEAGFGDLSYFNRAFRQKFGATPSDIRALSRGDE
jgi:AraC-like DNA-binding protein